ncbi:MAG: hypothetical protein JXJ04_15625 [Spirochaetales bacterium]|nr:hypothetical protein [Spirochaetales bacterium]
MTAKCIHDFHFIMDSGLKDKLQSINWLKKPVSLSGIMVMILELLIPVIRKEQKWGRQRLSKYMAVCDDPEKKREHVHAYLPEELYRELKLLHQDLNFYSIAQMARGFLIFFLDLADMYKDNVIQELNKIFSRWKSEDHQTRLTPREFLRQLWKIIQFLPGSNRLVTIYDNQFSPFWILRI